MAHSRMVLVLATTLLGSFAFGQTPNLAQVMKDTVAPTYKVVLTDCLKNKEITENTRTAAKKLLAGLRQCIPLIPSKYSDAAGKKIAGSDQVITAYRVTLKQSITAAEQLEKATTEKNVEACNAALALLRPLVQSGHAHKKQD